MKKGGFRYGFLSGHGGEKEGKKKREEEGVGRRLAVSTFPTWRNVARLSPKRRRAKNRRGVTPVGGAEE